MKKSPAAAAILLLLVGGTMLFACATPSPEQTVEKIVWPKPPADARIIFVREFTDPGDLGIRRGFFQWLGDVLTGEEEVKMVRPMAVVATLDQLIYVADPGSHGVHRYDLQEKEYQLIRQENGQLLASPVGLALGINNTVYVVDSELAQVFRIRPDSDFAEPVFSDLALSQPTGIAFSNDNQRLYITDTAEHHIKIYDLQSKRLETFGHRGNQAGNFNFPTYLWVDPQDRLYVTDSLNFRVQIFSASGDYITQFGKAGDGSGNLSRPKGITVDRHGHIYVMDAMFHALQIFDQDGNLLLPIGQQGNHAGEFWLPVGIFIDGKDEIYIADSHNRRVQVLRYLGGNA